MSPTVHYHCPCLSEPTPTPPPPHLASSSHSFHPLHSLFFCVECDIVRCNRCVSVEVSGYYCPNCLFEVPSASVRAEKNRCARNCFMCPNCRNTVSPDPAKSGGGRILALPTDTNGETQYVLYCTHCRWDSAELGIVFEKPTRLAAQLQQSEDCAPDSLEFGRLEEHLEPIVQPKASAASVRSGRGTDEDLSVYHSRVDIASASRLGTGGGDADVEYMRHLEDVSEVANLEQRWLSSWATSLQTADLKLLRIPLHSKRTKRCPSCTHMLIKPEQNTQSESVQYKIKLMAANYLPSITAALPHQQDADIELAKRALCKLPVTATANDNSGAVGGMHTGKSYPFQLALTNPLYDPIRVRLSVQRIHAPAVSSDEPGKSRRPPFAVSLPSTSFSVAALAEEWEYDLDDEVASDGAFALDHDDLGVTGHESKEVQGKTKVGVLEKKGNTTIVGGEIVIGKEARGNVKFNMLVSFTYRDDAEVNGDNTMPNAAATSPLPETKTFAFYTVVDLGAIIPRELAEASAVL
ncbi:dynactin subunit 4 [Favolaschia claudopus]|uniref:Dynactin subunit 4 n=1 Tax=Favolaschia claudopus TaxID=2862362 RepID=A0AAW0DDD5_9AGAR